VDAAHRAEALGYSTLLPRDHFVPEPFGEQLAPPVALTAAAGATRSLRVGSLVLDNDYRHPLDLAKEAATPICCRRAGSSWAPGPAGCGTRRSPWRVARKVEWVEQAAEERTRQVELSMVMSVAPDGDHCRHGHLRPRGRPPSGTLR
jgi:hypothetical protein